MSIENRKTVEVYKKYAYEYLESIKKHEQLDMKGAKIKKEQLHIFLKDSFKSIPKGEKILEIGAGNGELSRYLADIGYNVTVSDVADTFLSVIKDKGFNPIKFNVLEEDFNSKYSGVLCWRVFAHFTKGDAKKTLEKTYDALNKNGIFVFNAKNREEENISGEWIDYPNEYHMGVERFFNSFNKNELDKMINKVGFEIISFYKEGGENNNKWLVYVLKK